MKLRWELDWLLKMQADDGRVYHKLSTIKFGGFIPPEDETERRYFSPWGSAATADFVAVMAQAARVFRPFDEEFAQRCLAAAKKSYHFLQQHPEDHRPDLSAFETGPVRCAGWRRSRVGCRRDFGRRRAMRNTCAISSSESAKQVSEPRMSGNVVDIDWDWGNVAILECSPICCQSGRDVMPRSSPAFARDAIRVADQIVEHVATAIHTDGRWARSITGDATAPLRGKR